MYYILPKLIIIFGYIKIFLNFIFIFITYTTRNDHTTHMDLSSYLLNLRIKKNMVFDPVRKKWLIIQPEELVRQATIQYLLEDMNLPLLRIAVERSISIHNQVRRFDIVYYDRQSQPRLLVECKSPATRLTAHVLEQAVWYNYEIKAPYLLLTNGKNSIWYKVNPYAKTYNLLQAPPKL